MNDKKNRLIALHDRLQSIANVTVLQIDDPTNSVGVSFGYLGATYTAYADATTESVELLQHNVNDITQVENIGTTTVNDLVAFFSDLPEIQTICK